MCIYMSICECVSACVSEHTCIYYMGFYISHRGLKDSSGESYSNYTVAE